MVEFGQVPGIASFLRQAAPVPRPHWIIQSVVATGGVYKGQGRSQRDLMNRAYKAFLVEDR